MKPSTIPVSCGLALTAMFAAGISHWWSVEQFADALEAGIPALPAAAATDAATDAPAPLASPTQQPLAAISSPALAVPASDQQKAFYEALIEKMARVENQNRDLLDQLAETNRDLMKLEFRVDTHSESFRPMPLIEEKPTSRIDHNTGVLPPRAEPLSLPSYD